jgi:hypothetical protein
LKCGKRTAQHKVLIAFAIDPQLGSTFMNITQSYKMEQKRIVEEEWVSKKKILEEYDESEAEELLEIGALEKRTHPKNPRRLQFKRITEKESRVAKKEQSIASNSKAEATDGCATRFQKMVEHVDMKKGVKKGADSWRLMSGGAAGATSADESSDDDRLLPSMKKKQPPTRQHPNPPAAVEFDRASIEAVPAADVMSKVMKLRALLTKSAGRLEEQARRQLRFIVSSVSLSLSLSPSLSSSVLQATPPAYEIHARASPAPNHQVGFVNCVGQRSEATDHSWTMWTRGVCPCTFLNPREVALRAVGAVPSGGCGCVDLGRARVGRTDWGRLGEGSTQSADGVLQAVLPLQRREGG